MDHNYAFLHCLLFSGVFVLSSSTSVPEYSDKFLRCSDRHVKCGDKIYNISYPFRSLADDESGDSSCGHPGFDLSCGIDDILALTIAGGKEYRLDSIDYKNHEIHITDLYYSVDQSPSACPLSFTNSSFNSSVFTYSFGDANLTVYWNCSPKVVSTALPRGLYDLGCESGLDSYYIIPEVPVAMDMWDVCTSMALIPINLTVVDDCINKSGHGDAADMFRVSVEKGFGLNWKVGGGWCDECEASNGICGFDHSAPDAKICYCVNAISNDGTCRPMSNMSSGDKGHKVKKIVIVSIGVSSGLILACLSLAFYQCQKWGSNSYHDQNVEAFIEKYGSLAPKRYTFSELKKATRSFGEKLGQGGYGSVFKGTLSDGRVVAVKVLCSPENSNGEEFLNEVASIGRTSHINVVSLLGFCYEGSKRALVYEFMCNGSLEKLVYSKEPKTEVDWERLYEIAIGVARGLEYLHRGCSTRIVHFDIKPHNILLDEDFCPKISDFGLAKLCRKMESMSSIVGTRGTIGYIAPEVFSRNFGVVSSKSDVYSYGMMVLEMAGGRNCPNAAAENSSEAYFPSWIYVHLDQSGGLQACGASTVEAERIARKLIMVGLWCIQTLPQNRPSMSKVIEMLEGSIDDLRLPPKPYMCSPLRSVMATSSVHDGDSRECSSSSSPLDVCLKETYAQT